MKDEWLESENWFDYRGFYDLVGDQKFSRLVEVGAWKGHSTRHLAKKCKSLWYPFELYAVDLWDKLPEDNPVHQAYKEQIPHLYKIFLRNMADAGVQDVVRELQASSLWASKCFDDESIDFVFIDADHSYESVKADIEAWLPKVKLGGWISGHDYPFAPVKKAVTEKFGPENQIGGVFTHGACWYLAKG